MSKIGQKIKTFRLKARKTQGELAEVLGISVPAFSKIENGITDVNSARIIQLAILFKVNAGAFFEETDDQRDETERKQELLLKQQQTTISELQGKLITCFEEKDELQKRIRETETDVVKH